MAVVEIPSPVMRRNLRTDEEGLLVGTPGPDGITAAGACVGLGIYTTVVLGIATVALIYALLSYVDGCTVRVWFSRRLTPSPRCSAVRSMAAPRARTLRPWGTTFSVSLASSSTAAISCRLGSVPRGYVPRSRAGT